MRPVIIGMNNPLSTDPRMALWPDPPGCTGHRIWRMLTERTGCTPKEYSRAFDRRNLVLGSWDRTTGWSEANRMLPDLAGREVLLLGVEVRQALRLPRTAPLIHPMEHGGVRLRCVPHPSGRSRWYNDKANRHMVALVLEELYSRSLSDQSRA